MVSWFEPLYERNIEEACTNTGNPYSVDIIGCFRSLYKPGVVEWVNERCLFDTKGAFFSNQSLANVVCRLLKAAKVETNTCLIRVY